MALGGILAAAVLAATPCGAGEPGTAKEIANLPTLTGVIKDAPGAKGRAAEALGHAGALDIRSKWRWDEFQKNLADLGWQKPAADSLADVNFDRDAILCIFGYVDEGSQFAVRQCLVGTDRVDVQIVMSYIIYKQRAEVVNAFKFMAVAIPKAKEVAVSVATFHPFNGGPYPSPEKAHPEWSAVLGPAAGDVVDDLRANISAKSPAVKAGEDIAVEFTLEFVSAATEKDGQFAHAVPAVHIWDGKYSEGYRNHAFLVVTPDGKTHYLRRQIVGQWDKNVPHLVEIKPGSPYALPEWFEGKTLKSLKALGLDTSQPGTYTITGLYEETGVANKTLGASEPAWGGRIAGNTIAVEVAK
jgi:hypothetical protein